MKTIEYWQVDSCFDRDVTHIGNFASEDIAQQIVAKGMGYRSVTKKVLTIFDSMEDFENNTREKIRARALAKLTPEEKIALGIN